MASSMSVSKFSDVSKGFCVELCNIGGDMREVSLKLKESLISSNILDIDADYVQVMSNNEFKKALMLEIADGLSKDIGTESSFGLGILSPHELYFCASNPDFTKYLTKKKIGLSLDDSEALKKSKSKLMVFITNTRNTVINYMDLENKPEKKQKTSATYDQVKAVKDNDIRAAYNAVDEESNVSATTTSSNATATSSNARATQSNRTTPDTPTISNLCTSVDSVNVESNEVDNDNIFTTRVPDTPIKVYGAEFYHQLLKHIPSISTTGAFIIIDTKNWKLFYSTNAELNAEHYEDMNDNYKEFPFNIEV